MITQVISTSGHLIPKFSEVRFHRTRIFTYRVVERMNADLASKNYYVILGQVPTRYVEDKIYGLEHVEQYLKEDKAI